MTPLPPPLAPAPPDSGAMLPPPGVNGIPGAMGMPAPPPQQPPDPSNMQYGTSTQQDGTVLIFIKNPDGTPGPVIDVYKPKHLGGGKK